MVINRMTLSLNRMAYYISQCKVETPMRRGGQLCFRSVAYLLQYLCAKNYTMRFGKVIAKIKWCIFAAQYIVNLEAYNFRIGVSHVDVWRVPMHSFL